MRMPGVSKEAKAVYALLCSYTGDKDYCFPTVDTLAEDLDCSPRQVIRLTEELQEKGLCRKDKLEGNNRKTAYIPLIPDFTTSAIDVTNEKKHDIHVTNESQIGDTHDTRTSDTHGTLILTTNTNTQENTNTHTAREGLEYGMIPPELVEPIKRYVKATNFKPNIGYIATHITIAVGRTSLKIVWDAINNVAAKAEKPGCNLDYIPKLSNLLSNTAKLIEWSAKSEPKIEHWWSGLSETAIIDRITSLLRYGIEIPQEVEKWIPQAQQKLIERLAG